MEVERFSEALEGLGVAVSPDLLTRFEQFESALYQANQVMNLTRVPREECWLRHFLDSLLFQDLIPQGSRVLDIGTGPGFPAWPLAAARPDLQVAAMDSSGKMLGFLRTQPLDNLTVIQSRAEEIQDRDVFDVVTGRAVAPLGIQLELSAPLVRRDGLVIPMRTVAEEAEIIALPAEKLGLKLESLNVRVLPVLEVARVFPIFKKVAKTPASYPRTWAEMKRKPLT